MPVMLPATMPVCIPESVKTQEQTPAVKDQYIATMAPDTHVVSKILMSSAQYQEITKNMDSLNKEVRMMITGDGIESRFVDNANVAMIQMEYKSSGFEMFKSSGSYEIGIDVTIWKKFSKMVKKGMLVLFELTQYEIEQSEKDKENDIHRYYYKYNLSCNGNTQTIKALDVETIRKKPNFPTIDLPTKINLYAADLISAINDAKSVSDKIAFTLDDKGFSAVSEGDTSTLNKQISINGRSGPGARSLFSLDYLSDYMKSIGNKKEIITVSMKTDHPLMINLSDDTREIIFLLAPRIEST